MTNRKFTIRDMYSAYLFDLEQIEKDTTEKYVSCREQAVYLYKILYPYSELIEKGGIKLNFTSEFKLPSYVPQFNEKDIYKAKINVITIDENLLKNYLIAYLRANLRLIFFQKNLNKIKYYRVPFSIYQKIIHYHNKKLAQKLLTGYVWHIGENVGNLYIKRIRRIFTIYGKDATLNIDWGETLKLRKHLLKSKIPIYNKETNPDGQKYLVYYTSDYMFWYWWERVQCKIPNNRIYTFTPTNFINTPDRSQLNFVANAKTKEDIIETDLLGNRDKLYCLVRFDPKAELNFITDEREHLRK